MTKGFHPVKVIGLRKVTADCVEITLDIPTELQAAFAYKQGQYLTFRQTIDNQEVKRSYSLCSSPLDNEWKVAVKQVSEGRFSTFANRILKVGDTLEVMEPEGRFYVHSQPTFAKKYVAFAAGSGITPILSIMRTHLQNETESEFKLFYSNRRVSSIIFREELEALKNQYMERLQVYYFLTEEQRQVALFNGRIDQEKLATISEHLLDVKAVDHYFLCGPNAMIFTIKDFLVARQVNSEKIHFELFNTDGIETEQVRAKIKIDYECEVTIKEGGKSFKFPFNKGAETILEEALNRNADLPFACKGGVCCACKAKLVEGEVKMLVNYGLVQEEVDDGYILTCQSVPTTKQVVVDFDA